MLEHQKQLRIEFSELLILRNPHSRGKRFEKILAELIRSEGHEVHINPGAAKPRQTDFTISCAKGHFIAETKWQKDKVDVNDVDSLRNRIRRSVPGTWGCLFSMSDYSKTALKELSADKTLPIVPFNAAEINLLFNRKISFLDMLTQKQFNLRTNGKLIFIDQEKPQSHPSFGTPLEHLYDGQKQKRWWECGATEFDLIYARDLPHIAAYSGAPQAVTTRIDVSSVSDLERVFESASKLLNLSGNGTFTIYQEQRNWQGIGLDNFLQCISSWKQRYAAQGWDSYHHSEELAYFEQLEIGLFSISARQRVNESPFLHSVHLELLLPGIPIDTDPFKTLMHDVGADNPFFYPKNEWRCRTIYLKPSSKLQILGVILNSQFEKRAVSGVIAVNPFFKADMKSVLGVKYVSEADWIAETEVLFCHLKDWIPYGTKVDEYKLMDFSFARIHGVKLLVPSCTWSRITKRISRNTLEKTVRDITRNYKSK